MTNPDPAATTTEEGARYILITECLQNDFFLNPECRLFLQDEAARRILLAKNDQGAYPTEGAPRRVPEKLIERGPLGLFLKAVVGERLAGRVASRIHVINIRDWHVPDDSYDAERRIYGRHCEAGSWGAGYIDGLEKYLDPEKPRPDGRARFCRRGSARIYHIHADSIFDFRPRWEERTSTRQKFHQSELERLLDVLITGSQEQVEDLGDVLEADDEADRTQSQSLNQLATAAVRHNVAADTTQLYVAVIGVYTDVKVQVILAGLRSRYELPNLAVSDTLTGSRSLERHLHGLDFSDKLLNVEVIHGIGDLAGFLGAESPLEHESATVTAENFAQYRSFFADKQSVLSYEAEKLQEYAQLTSKRAIGVYDTVRRANTFLLIWGSAFLALTFAGTILHLVSPHRWTWEMTAASGGLGLVQLVAAFFSKPMRDLQQNLNNLASFRMILEGHSLKTAFTRFHLTTPEVLRELKDAPELERAKAQIGSLETQLAVIDRFQASDYQALAQIVGHPVQAQPEQAAAPAFDALADATQNGAQGNGEVTPAEPAPTTTP
jgi:hypothetical protein